MNAHRELAREEPRRAGPPPLLEARGLIVAMERNSDRLPDIANGAIHGSIAQTSHREAFLAVRLLFWYNAGAIKLVEDPRASGADPLPETIVTGVVEVTKQNVDQVMAA